jgi:diketogulonate reductase-like aldo/keto reductase
VSFLISIQGCIPIPKSRSAGRIVKSNAEVFGFELTKEEIAHLDSLNEGLCCLITQYETRHPRHLVAR